MFLGLSEDAQVWVWEQPLSAEGHLWEGGKHSEVVGQVEFAWRVPPPAEEQRQHLLPVVSRCLFAYQICNHVQLKAQVV